MSQVSTGFIDGTTGVDIAVPLVDKSYLIDRYPELAETFRFAGLWLWGINARGNLGNNSIVHRSSPVQTTTGGYNWKLVAAGEYTIAAIKTDGTLWTWGDSQFGILGDNTTVNKSTPVQTVAGGTNWKQSAVGGNTAAAIKTDGTLWLWGYNAIGQLGDNTVVNKSSPVQTVSGGTNWKLVACGLSHTAAIKTDGTLWLWGGNNTNGQLGDNTVNNASSPIQTIAGGTNWRQVSANMAYHTAAIKTDGTLWTWGHNGFGVLGDNTTTHRSSPIQTIAGGTNWRQVAAGFSHTTAVKTDGTLWLWGYNQYGQLGDNTVVNKSSPVQTISGGTNWRQVSAGRYHTAAIKTDGTLWLWGNNQYGTGALGDNTTTHRSSPVQTVAGGTNWKQVAAGRFNTQAIRDNSSDVFGNPL